MSCVALSKLLTLPQPQFPHLTLEYSLANTKASKLQTLGFGASEVQSPLATNKGSSTLVSLKGSRGTHLIP